MLFFERWSLTTANRTTEPAYTIIKDAKPNVDKSHLPAGTQIPQQHLRQLLVIERSSPLCVVLKPCVEHI